MADAHGVAPAADAAAARGQSPRLTALQAMLLLLLLPVFPSACCGWAHMTGCSIAAEHAWPRGEQSVVGFGLELPAVRLTGQQYRVAGLADLEGLREQKTGWSGHGETGAARALPA